ncbi:MAG: TlpA disulfide reductase family protein [Rudaea sp.]
MARRKGSSRGSRPRSFSPLFGLAVLVVVLLGLGAAGGLLSGGSASASASRSGSSVAFTVNDFNGKPVTLSDYRGHPVLVNLWASWCPPCRAEMPGLIQFYGEHKGDGFVLIAVNSTDTLSPAKQFAQQQGMDFPVLFDPEGKLMQTFGTEGLPASYLIDRNGNIIFSHVGGMSPSMLQTQIAPLLSQ